MLFKALLVYIDTHVHIDQEENGFPHGLHPDELVALLMRQSHLDGAVVLGHDSNVRRDPRLFFQHVNDVRGPLTDRIILPAIEVSVRHEGEPYHVGVLFEGEYHSHNLPPHARSTHGIERFG